MLGVTLSTKIHYDNKPFVEEYADVCLWAYRELFADKIFVVRKYKDTIEYYKTGDNCSVKNEIINTLLKVVLFCIKILTFIPGIILGVLPKIYAYKAYDQVEKNHKRVNDYLQRLNHQKNHLNENSKTMDSDPIEKSYTFEELMNSDLDKEKLFLYASDKSYSHTENLALMTRVAKMGHAEAMFLVGQSYRWGHDYSDDRKGKEIEINIPEAIIWFQKAASAGFHKAFGNLATIHFNGEGVLADKLEAKKWLLLGFKNGAKTLTLQGTTFWVFSNSEQVEKRFKEIG